MKSWKREAVHTGRESQATIKSFGRNGAPTFLLSYAISRYFSRTTNFHELTFLEANSFSLAGRPPTMTHDSFISLVNRFTRSPLLFLFVLRQTCRTFADIPFRL